MILGAVLIGGRSSRFGSEKAQALFAGDPLVTHARRLIEPFVDRVVLAGGADLPDLPVCHLGPLGGIAAALAHAGASGYVSVLTIGCDMPRLPDGLLDRLVRRAPAYCPQAPVLGHWPADLRARLLSHLAGDDRSMRSWAQAVGAIPIEASGVIANVNRPEDLAAL